MWSKQTLHLIEAAYNEDLGARGDLTSHLRPEPDALVTARVVPRKGSGLVSIWDADYPLVLHGQAKRLPMPPAK